MRNEKVSSDFVIALKIFIDILKEKGITTIKVPLLQVFNYDFHQNCAEYLNKEDIISANKMERLLATFYLVAEKYDELEIITDPFIESENLICKINYQKEKRSHL